MKTLGKPKFTFWLEPGGDQQVPEEVLNTITLLVWTGKQPERAKNTSPVQIKLKLRAIPVWVPQYQISFATRGLELLIDKFLLYGLICEGQSSFNTPIHK